MVIIVMVPPTLVVSMVAVLVVVITPVMVRPSVATRVVTTTTDGCSRESMALTKVPAATALVVAWLVRFLGGRGACVGRDLVQGHLMGLIGE